MKSLVNFADSALSRAEMKNVIGGDVIYCSYSVWYDNLHIVGLGACSMNSVGKCDTGYRNQFVGASHVKVYGCYTAPGGTVGGYQFKTKH
ncbi:hypothetical protein [Cellulophaga sp. BC115SP]|uniref:hypothetical protein n=1 Tax=Cellulophaga sp. BC115SP TaxID=2683263 RepID=UPI0014129C9E|nr:hypothetical protein [Cellulophaga sp. BC115SP]NBB28226.1 hypothetical protein [Cellulophaga sp. BC115SP]